MGFVAFVVIIGVLLNILYIFFMMDIFNKPSKQNKRLCLCDFFSCFFMFLIGIDRAITDTDVVISSVEFVLYYLFGSLLTYHTLHNFSLSNQSYILIINILSLIGSIFSLVIVIEKKLDIYRLPLRANSPIFITLNSFMIIIPGMLSIPAAVIYSLKTKSSLTVYQVICICRVVITALCFSCMPFANDLVYDALFVTVILTNSLSIIGIFKLNDNNSIHNRNIGSLLLLNVDSEKHIKHIKNTTIRNRLYL